MIRRFLRLMFWGGIFGLLPLMIGFSALMTIIGEDQWSTKPQAVQDRAYATEYFWLPIIAGISFAIGLVFIASMKYRQGQPPDQKIGLRRLFRAIVAFAKKVKPNKTQLHESIMYDSAVMAVYCALGSFVIVALVPQSGRFSPARR